MSGMPVAAPALSLHASIALTPFDCRNNAVVPTIATESLHAAEAAFAASVGLSFASPCFTTTLRQASPPLELMYSPQALIPSHEPLNRPGRMELFTSATTVTVIVVGETPTSVAFSGVSHLPGLSAVVVVAPPRPSPPSDAFPLPPPPHAVTTSTRAVARTHQRSRISFSPGVAERAEA